jgi:hypothetical protein
MNTQRMMDEQLAALLVRAQLAPLEGDLLARWWARWGQEFSEYEFAHRFGPPAIPTEGLSGPLLHWAEVVSRLRADMIARRGAAWYIFEIKPIAKPAALGQLLAYAHYWPQEFPDRPAPRLAIICELIPEYMRAPLAAWDVEVFEV